MREAEMVAQCWIDAVSCERDCIGAQHERRLAGRWQGQRPPPQPGFVGRGFASSRLLFVAQNPHAPSDPPTPAEDETFRALAEIDSTDPIASYRRANEVVLKHLGRYGPAREAGVVLNALGLSFSDVAYTNVVILALENATSLS